MRIRAWLAPLVAVVLLPGCAPSPALFSEANARAHVAMLAGTIGSRPAGTEANARARAYVVDQLRLNGFDVRVQEADAERPALGRTARVANIIAVLPGTRPEAFGIVSHYDSAPSAPGAADDGLGVAVAIETARVVAARAGRRWSTMILVTDAEEAGLMGAAALVTDPEVAGRLRAYVNLEAAGSSGPAVLFEAGPGNAWLVSLWAREAAHPRGGSFGAEIYRRLPNDTDFSILKLSGVPGLNFASVGDSTAYHTARDTPDRLSPAVLRQLGDNVVALSIDIDRVDITQRSAGEATYFDIGGTLGVSYGQTAGWVLGLASLVLGALAAIKALAFAVRLGGVGRWLLTAVWAGAGALATVASMIGATWALRAAREVYHPWYARPGRLILLLAVIALSAAWAMTRAGRLLPPRLHGVRHPMVTWSLTLPLWILLASAAVWLAPTAAYLFTIPLLAISVGVLTVPGRSTTAVRVVSIVALVVAGMFWLRDTVVITRFMVGVFGRLPVITPVNVFAAVLALAGAMLLPPALAAFGETRPLLRPSIATTGCLAAITVAAGLAYAAPAYTFDAPLRRHVRALQEAAGDTAVWEVGSVEPGLDLSTTAGAPGGWTLQRDAQRASVPWGTLPHPFVFRTVGPGLGPAPLAVQEFRLTPLEAGAELTLVVQPRRQGLTLSIVLPEGLTPATTSMPGVVRLGRWMATYVAVPPDGLTWTATFASSEAQQLQETRLAVTDSGFPSGSPWQRLPGWLPQERTVWTASATWALPATVPPPVEPAAPLR